MYLSALPSHPFLHSAPTLLPHGSIYAYPCGVDISSLIPFDTPACVVTANLVVPLSPDRSEYPSYSNHFALVESNG